MAEAAQQTARRDHNRNTSFFSAIRFSLAGHRCQIWRRKPAQNDTLETPGYNCFKDQIAPYLVCCKVVDLVEVLEARLVALRVRPLRVAELAAGEVAHEGPLDASVHPVPQLHLLQVFESIEPPV